MYLEYVLVYVWYWPIQLLSMHLSFIACMLVVLMTGIKAGILEHWSIHGASHFQYLGGVIARLSGHLS